MKVKSISKFIILITIFLLFLIFSLTSSYATTYYVSPTGNDSNSGSISSPFRTIQKAANIVNPGDTVIVKNGTYTDTDGNDIIVNFNKGGTSSAWITVKAENKWGAILDGQNNATGFCFYLQAYASYVRIEDFEMKGCEYGGFWSNAGADNVYLYRNKIHDIGREVNCNLDCGGSTCGIAGVYQGTNCTNYTYDSNVIYKIGRFSYGCSGTDLDTKFYNHDHGMYLNSDNVIIKNNIFYDNMSGWDIKISGKYEENGVDNWDIINNTFYNYGSSIGIKGQIFLWGKGTNLLIQNNISHTPGAGFVYQHGDTPDDDTAIVKNNLIYGSSCAVVGRGTDCITPLNWSVSSNIIGKDPQFVDLINKDFHLQSGSPAIDKGIAFSGRTKDADGNSIVGAPDIGAYEVGGVSEDTIPPAPPEIIEVK